jgi:hypothetical protein
MVVLVDSSLAFVPASRTGRLGVAAQLSGDGLRFPSDFCCLGILRIPKSMDATVAAAMALLSSLDPVLGQ